jgi:hypothetical protein
MAGFRYRWLVFFATLALLAPASRTPADDAPPAGTGVSQPDGAAKPSPSGSAGMVIYRDPGTGRIGGVPPAGTAGLPMPRFGNAVQVLGTSPGGGVKLERPGGFMSTMSAAKDAAGKVSTHCAPSAGAREE